MPFALLDLLKSMRNRVVRQPTRGDAPIRDAFDPSCSGISARDRRNQYHEEFARHCRERRFY